jgi:hypothetical protein
MPTCIFGHALAPRGSYSVHPLLARNLCCRCCRPLLQAVWAGQRESLSLAGYRGRHRPLLCAAWFSVDPSRPPWPSSHSTACRMANADPRPWPVATAHGHNRPLLYAPPCILIAGGCPPRAPSQLVTHPQPWRVAATTVAHHRKHLHTYSSSAPSLARVRKAKGRIRVKDKEYGEMNR